MDYLTLHPYFYLFWEREREERERESESERAREREQAGQGQTEGETESQADYTIIAKPDMGLELTNCEIVTLAKIKSQMLNRLRHGVPHRHYC